MIRTKSILSLSPAARVRIAGAASGLAVLLALGLAHAPQAGNSPQENSPEPAAAAPRIAAQEATAALRSYAYYPEQLAALQSLGQFQPIADAGQKPEPQAVALAAAVRPAAGDAKATRRAEPTAKLAAATAVPTPLAPVPAAVAPPPAPENPVKIFGLPLPGASSLPGAGLRDTAAHWSEAAAGLGGKIASFWR